MISTHIFPFEMVEKNSRIIIYGAGKVGQEFISQIKITKYCEILFVVDINYKDKKDSILPVYPIEKISETNNYDWIIISVESEELASQIKKDLQAMNIDLNKVIHPINRAIPYDEFNISHPDQWWGGCTFAQHGDDLMVLNIFYYLGINKPSYIDIGANHPYHISNTALLYKRGCRGINVEANPDLIDNFFKERPEDTNISAGVGLNPGALPFYMIDQSDCCNSFSKEAVDNFISKFPCYSVNKIINVPIITLKEIIEKYSNNIFPDYLTIDVEGLDYQILNSYNMTINGPKVISVEICVAQSSDKRLIKDLLLSYGYFIYCKTGVNYIFVKSNYKQLLY